MLKSIFPIMAVVCAVAAFGLAACAGLSPGAAILSPRGAFLAEVGVRGVADVVTSAAHTGRLSTATRATLATCVRDVQRGLPALRSAYDSGDYLGAALQFSALVTPAAQAHALATGQPSAVATSNLAAGLALFSALAQNYAQAKAILAGDPAGLPAAISDARSHTDASVTAALEALGS